MKERKKEIKINADELRKALKDIEAAEKNGFMYCEAVFSSNPGWNDHWIVGKYVDMLEKAHPTNRSLNWGRGQNVTKRNIFKDGKVIPTDKEKERRENYPASEAIEEGEIDGYRYWIVDNSKRGMCGYNGYVAFPKRPTIEEGYGGILTYVPVHGGITYASEGKFGMVYGFDTAHSDSEEKPRMDKKWIKMQCEKMIKGILKAAEVEKKYLTAKKQETKAKYAQVVLDTDETKEDHYNFGIGIAALSGRL